MFPTLDYSAQLLRPGEATGWKRETANTFTIVLGGEGTTEIAGHPVDWATNDLFVVRVDGRQVGPTPWHGQHHAVVESDQHPRHVVAPEDPADATPLTARRTLFRQDGEARTAQCNIRCSLSLG